MAGGRDASPGAGGQPSAFELQRAENIHRNNLVLASMGLEKKLPAKAGTKRKAPQKAAAAPARRSTRQRAEVDYTVEKTFGETADPLVADKPRKVAVDLDFSAFPVPQRTVTASVGGDVGGAVPRDKNGRLKFKDHPEFQPNLTPKQMIRAGIFGGCYFNPRGGKPGIKHPKGIPGVSHKEYPKDWFEGLDPSMYISRRYNVPTNAYGVKAGQDQVFWEEKGWIHPQDPRGWFQWYTRFYLGRRTGDDERQISRWTGVAGPKGRWKRALVNKIIAQGKRFDDASVSPVIRQTLLHWGYELVERDFLTMAKS